MGAIVARYRDYEEYGDRGPRRRSPSRRARYSSDDYERPRRPASSRYGYDRPRPPGSRRAPPSRRTRSRAKQQGTSPGLIIGLITNSVLVTVVGIIYLFFPATWQRIIHFRDYTPPLAAGADVIVLAHAVPWGTLSLDDGATSAPTTTVTPSGTAQPTASPQASNTPQPTTTAQPSVTARPSNVLKSAGTTADGTAWYRLARGTHTLVYTAAPFATLRCQISVPAASSDTCALALPPQTQSSAGIRALGAAMRMVDAQATVDHLPPEQQKPLFDAIQAALSPQPTTVQPYERYLNATGQAVYTYVTLQATLLYTVNTDAAHAIPLPTPTPSATPTATGSPTGTPVATAVTTPTGTATATGTPTPPATCLSLCDTLASSDLPVDAWNQLVNLLPGWRYVPARGQPITAQATAQGSAATSAVVFIRWDGQQWQVGGKDTDKALLLSNTVLAAASTLHLPSGWSVKAYPAANPADGYLVVTGPSTGASAQVLYRFGVLLSVNSLAYTTFPSLPHANFAERTLAAGIKTQ